MDVSNWAASHPVGWGAVGGLLVLAIGLLLVDAWWIGVIAGLLFGGFNWWLWSSRGPAHNWRAAILRKLPKKP